MKISDRIEIAKSIQQHHYLFRAFWDMVDIEWVEDPDIDVGAVWFDQEGDCLKLSLNEDFWLDSNEHTRMFVVAHECLHVILEHGKRFSEWWGKSEFNTMNVAADIVIDHMLENSFGFDRSKLPDRITKEGCWIDTVFEKNPPPHNQSTEYYFNLLKKKSKELPVQPFDNHIALTKEEAEDLGNLLGDNGFFDNIDDEFIEKISSNKEEYKTLKDYQEKNQTTGSGGGAWTTVKAKKTKKKKWETVIKKWEYKTKEYSVDIESRWDRVAPRYSEVMNTGKFYLPSESWMIGEFDKENKIDVFFFLDTSGSCYHLKDRFFKAARSLDPKRFNVRLFSFDTRVEEVNIKTGRVYGGGGTSFSIIENKIQEIIKREKKKYPHSVWIISDGYGNTVRPQKPEKWHWFLTPSSTSGYIPKQSNIYKLSNFE
jgi:predicted metal-dependent peptidase